jgi:hypothetical protein
MLLSGSRELPNALFRPTVGLELNSSRICSRDLTCARAIRGSRLLKRFCGGTCELNKYCGVVQPQAKAAPLQSSSHGQAPLPFGQGSFFRQQTNCVIKPCPGRGG